MDNLDSPVSKLMPLFGRYNNGGLFIDSIHILHDKITKMELKVQG